MRAPPDKVESKSATSVQHKMSIAVLAGATSATLFALLLLYEPGARNLWFDTLFNSAHVPVFWSITIGIFIALGVLPTIGFGRRLAVSSGLAILLGAVSELIQSLSPRDASLQDLTADWLGTISAVLFIVAVARYRTNATWWRMYLAASVCIAVMATLPLLFVSAAYLERNNQLPIIVDFNSRFGDSFYRLQDSTLYIAARTNSSEGHAIVTLGDGPWPGVIFHDIWPVWSEYDSLLIVLGQDSGDSLDINIRVHDLLHRNGDQLYSDRFNMTYNLSETFHTIRIPIAAIRNAPRNRVMDMTKIDGLAIFATRQDRGRSLNLLKIELAKSP